MTYKNYLYIIWQIVWTCIISDIALLYKDLTYKIKENM